MHDHSSSPRSSEPRHSAKGGLALETVPGRFAICRLPPGRVPRWAFRGDFVAIARSKDELSVVCEQQNVPERVRAQRDWCAIRVAGTLDLSLTGVLVSLAVPLAEAGIGIFSLSTFDTDYLLVRAETLDGARATLEAAGHRFDVPQSELVARAGPPPAEAAAASPAAVDQPVPSPGDERRAKPRDRATEKPIEQLASTEPAPAEPAPTELAPAEPAPAEPAPAEPAPAEKNRYREPEPEDEIEDADLAPGAIPQHEVDTTEGSFDTLGLSPPILATIAEVGFVHPTPIQAAVIPEALEGHDVIGLAETGSGKTAAFALPLAERLTHGRGVRGLILCPTREIALQTKAFLDLFGKDHDLETVCVIGGVKIGPQIDHLKRQPDILVATPGRLLDHLERGTVRLDRLAYLVLDEADHMLDLGFLPQIQAVLRTVPDDRQTMLFSATMPPPIARLTARFMNDPVHIDFRPKGRTAAGIEHRLYLVVEKDKRACLEALLDEIEGSTLVFTRRKIEAEWLARQLQQTGHRAERLHSDRSQAQRVQALRAFRNGTTRVLVATDVAARGLDVPRIGHVVNFDFPEMVEDYVHRAGRTARGTAAGIVSSIGTWKDKVTVREIERAIGQKLPRATVEGVEPYVELAKRKVIRRRLL